MATTKIWAVTDSLKRVVDYARNPDKTKDGDNLWAVIHYASSGRKATRYDEACAFVTGVACSSEHVYEEMVQVKVRFGKAGGKQAYHAYQSFKPGEVTPQQCHEIGVDLARRLWGSRYQVLVCTHLDRSHYHNHFVINSVSYTDGRRFDCSQRTYYEFCRVSDELCKGRGLSVIEHPKGHTPRSLHFAEKAGEPTRYNLMREAIDKAMSISYTEKQFAAALLKMGYQISESDTRKYPTIRSVNAKKATRLYHLGEDYLPNAIRKRIWMNPPSVKVEWARFQYPARAAEAKRYRCRGSVQDMRRLTGLQALFFIFGCLIGVYPANAPPQRRRKPLSPEMKEACRRLDRFTQQVTLLSRQHLKTEEDVKDFIASSGHELDTLLKARRKLYDKVSRADSEQEKDAIRQQYGDYTQRITELRMDIRTAERILADEPKMQECVAAEKEVYRLQRQLEAPQKKIQRNRGYER